MSAAPAKGAASTGRAKGPNKIPFMIALINSAAVVGAVGFLGYSKLIYQRPAITEETERERLAAIHASPRPELASGTVTFEPLTVNIAATPGQPAPADGTAQQIHGKLHYVNLGFVLEINDVSRKPELENLKSQVMDRLLSLLGRKQFHELSNVQGRYVLRSQIIELVNEMVFARAAKDASPGPLVTNVFFTQFTVQ